MKTAFWSYVMGQLVLVGIALMGKMSIWISLVPTFALISISAGLVFMLLLLELMFNYMDTDDPFGWDSADDDDDDDDDEDEKDS